MGETQVSLSLQVPDENVKFNTAGWVTTNTNFITFSMNKKEEKYILGQLRTNQILTSLERIFHFSKHNMKKNNKTLAQLAMSQPSNQSLYGTKPQKKGNFQSFPLCSFLFELFHQL